MIHTTMMIFILKNMVALEIKTAREDVVALEVECMVVWVGHHPWAEVDGLDLVLVETWVLDPVVLGEEWEVLEGWAQFEVVDLEEVVGALEETEEMHLMG